MKIDWPVITAFICILCMVALSDIAKVPEPYRNVFGFILIGSWVALGISMMREARA